MKRISSIFLFSLATMSACSQKNNPNEKAAKSDAATNPENTLLWKISGNGLDKPSYLFGTIHMLCADDAGLSKNMKAAIAESDEVYLEVDMDNLFEMFGVLGKLKMNGDTTLQELLSKDDYKKVKEYFEKNNSMLPFSMLESFKPLLAASMLEQGALPCDNTAMMEQVIMEEANKSNKKIKGLETMAYQASVLDSIPYSMQAQQLVEYVNGSAKGEKENKQINDMFDAYRSQDLKKLEALMVETEAGMSSFMDVLLFNRNRNWVHKLKTLLPQKSLMIAVGAGHLPGEKGVINLLRKEGYTVTPVEKQLNKGREI